MTLIKDGKPAEDPWIKVSDGEAVPSGNPAIVSYDRWIEDRSELAGRNSRLGILLKSDQSPALIAGDLQYFDLVALEFPVFKDGRAFSYARLLRERFGYQGEIRAVGNVLRDQFQFMLRCGFNAFEPAKQHDAEAWDEAVHEITLAYQPAADDLQPAISLRERKRRGVEKG